jgi:TctA family transporter
MDILGNLAIGFQTALLAENLLYCFVGVLLGTLIGCRQRRRSSC